MLNIKQSGIRWIWLSIFFILLDQLTKFLAVHFLSGMRVLTITPFLKFVLVENHGAAFSLFASQSGWQIIFFSCLAIMVSVMLLIWLRRLSAQQIGLCIALNCIIAGALGNFIDRARLGHVIDFIALHYQTYYWPVFNLADTIICLGAGMLVIHTLRSSNPNVA